MKKTVSLTFQKRSDARSSVTARLQVQNEHDLSMVVDLEFSPEEFARLMSGSVISVEEQA